MSHYTSIILYIPSSEDVKQRLEEVNRFEYNNAKIGFVDLNDTKKFPDIFPRYLYASCFNHFPLSNFLTHLQTQVKWEDPHLVQVLVEDERHENCSFYTNAGAVCVYESKHL